MQGIRNTVGQVNAPTARDLAIREIIRERGAAGNHRPITDAEIATALAAR